MSYHAYAHDAVRVGLGALATIALFASVPAAASEPANEVRVGYSDLDLTGSAGQETLEQRIRGAVKRVCRPTGPSATSFIEHKACKRAAYAGARSQMKVAIARAGERKMLAIGLAYADPTTGR